MGDYNPSKNKVEITYFKYYDYTCVKKVMHYEGWGLEGSKTTYNSMFDYIISLEHIYYTYFSYV
ncbi:MAG: hypothetical protein QW728_03970 [Thermoplasmata archaeon]